MNDEEKIPLSGASLRMHNLAKTFAWYADRLEKDHEGIVKSFKEKHPDEKLPDELLGKPIIPRALQIICEEILALMERK